jgi:hypothetical protein
MAYQRLILEVTSCRPEDCPEIEELMRSEYPTLNNLDRLEFSALARDAYEALKLTGEQRLRTARLN